jgi:S-adenosyl-L-methionine hydrolase (adenosine-forming)
MIVLFTDFGLPYTGQMRSAVRQAGWQGDIISLFDDVPSFNPKASAYLLAAYADDFPDNSVFVCVVDPGVGGDRAPVAVKAGAQWFIGPDNGLFEVLLRRRNATAWRITWQPDSLSASFHGRDLFSPVAAMLVTGIDPAKLADPHTPLRMEAWPDELAEIIYIDGFGNAITGLRAEGLSDDAEIEIAGRRLSRAETFSNREPGQAFWYNNANGLVEISINLGRADQEFRLKPGNSIKILNK